MHLDKTKKISLRLDFLILDVYPSFKTPTLSINALNPIRIIYQFKIFLKLKAFEKILLNPYSKQIAEKKYTTIKELNKCSKCKKIIILFPQSKNHSTSCEDSLSLHGG